MTRLDIVYDGHPYSMASSALRNSSVPELKERILAAVAGGEPFWLTVNEGAGTLKSVDLLIGPATQISLAEITSN